MRVLGQPHLERAIVDECVMAGPNLQIAVVGGSIAGCCAAVELTRAGHHAEIFERSAGALVGQGAGIGVLPATLDSLIARDLVDANMPRVSVREHVFAAKTPALPRMGRQALRLPMSSMSLNWADLHANLRKRVPQDAYHAGAEVCAIESASDRTTLVFADGVTRSFDLAVFADGYASLSRRFICPEVEPSYRGHVLWRGVLDVSQLTDPAPLSASVYRLSYRGLPAHAMVYRIPAGADAAADSGGLANIGCYVPVSSDALAGLLIDRNGRRHAASLAPGEVRPEEQARFKAYVREALPDYFDELISTRSG
jgi:2-polyprenyl-6-methoxyphenol hydroxylase-like FAD-dependent oxidoreductase